MPSTSPTAQRREVGALLRAHRERAGLKAVDAARRAGISAAKLSRLERGLRGLQLADVQTLCTLYGLGDQVRTGSAVDRAIDAAAAEQRMVRGIDDGIDIEGGDVADQKLDLSLVDFDGGERRGRHEGQSIASDDSYISSFQGEGKEKRYAAVSLTRSSVDLRPISPKCRSRKRRAARRPARCSNAKKS